MEPVTHILTGTCLARAGLNRRAAYATVAMAVAAEFPDLDTLWNIRGPVAGFQHHRGITHTLLGLPFEAAVLLLLFWLIHQWRVRRAPAAATRRPSQRAPVRWGVLYLLLLLALLSHILLDYTNNYGVRPFFPFNPRWYAASIVFIFDPLLFLFLVAGLVLPGLFALIGQEVGAKRAVFRGAGWARAALLCVVALWLVRAYEHGIALTLANEQVLQAPVVDDSSAPVDPDSPPPNSPGDASLERRPSLTPLKSLASPDPLSIFRWYTATDYGAAYQLGTANTRIAALSPGEVLTKPSPTRLLRVAEGSRLGQVYLDWSPMPWVSTDASSSVEEQNPEVTILFQDLRFMGATPLLRPGEGVPLTGIVILTRLGQVVEQGLDGRFDR